MSDEREQPAAPTLAARRLHPAGAVLSALDDVRNALFSVVVLIVLGSQSGNLGTILVLLGVVGAAIAVATGYLRWRAETYEIADAAIRHRHGVISPDETVVPLARVHSIDVAQGPIQRIFGVDELHVQTAGGGEKGEIVLRAVSPAETARLRAAAGLPEATATDLPEWRLSPRGLILVGLTAPQLGMLLPLVGGAFAVGNDLLGQQGARDTLADRLPTETGAILLLIAAAVLAAWLLSFLGSLVAFAGFSVTRDGDHLRIHRGFLQRRATSVPLRRVHAVSVAEGPFRRPFGLCSVRLETAGHGSEAAAARTLFPLLPIAGLDAQLASFVPALAGTGAPPAFTRPPRRAIRRYLLPGTITVLLLAIAATVAWAVAWPAIPVLTALAALDGLARYRSAGSQLDSSRLLLRRGSITRRTLIARRTRLQDHSFAQSTFQNQADLADISITVASGTSSKVAHLEATDATTLFERLRPGRSSPSLG
ncbi:MAG TPA: PH domain-containing protein [Thermoleophilaceae bacterium]|nr:PH domain-containing protein [Thermoleophilaceae bacterium]